MIIPTYFISSIADIDFSLLKEHGYKNILLDKDNAVTVGLKMNIPESILPNLNKGKNVFGSDHFMIFSNSVGTKQEDRHFKKADEFERKWNIKVAHHNSKKPNGYDEIIPKEDCSKSIMVGDSLTTDIYGGNQNGLLTVLVLPLSKCNRSFYKSCQLTKYDLFSCYGVMGILYFFLIKKHNYKPQLINKELDACFKNNIEIK